MEKHFTTRLLLLGFVQRNVLKIISRGLVFVDKIKCLLCGEMTIKTNSKKKFCSVRCQEKYRYRNNIKGQRDKLLTYGRIKNELNKYYKSIPSEDLIRIVKNKTM